MRQAPIHLIRSVLLLIAPILYWAAVFVVVGDLPIGPMAWDAVLFFAFVGAPILVVSVCRLQYFSKDKPFRWLTIVGFAFVMTCFSLFVLFRVRAALQYTGRH